MLISHLHRIYCCFDLAAVFGDGCHDAPLLLLNGHVRASRRVSPSKTIKRAVLCETHVKFFGGVRKRLGTCVPLLRTGGSGRPQSHVCTVTAGPLSLWSGHLCLPGKVVTVVPEAGRTESLARIYTVRRPCHVAATSRDGRV
jgi:hypothetical protein